MTLRQDYLRIKQIRNIRKRIDKINDEVIRMMVRTKLSDEELPYFGTIWSSFGDIGASLVGIDDLIRRRIDEKAEEESEE